MKFKSLLLITIIFLFFSVSAVSAADLNNTQGDDSLTYVDDSSVVEHSSEINGLNTNQYEILNGADLDTDSKGTFDDLQVEINNAPSGSVLNLTRDYDGAYGSRIHLNKDLTIDGQGHTLDCLNTECSAFYSNSGNIVLKNIKIINGHNDDNYQGGAIHIDGSAQYYIENCTFNNNWADDSGGAIYNGVNKTLTIINCQFYNNEVDDMWGGAIYSEGYLILKNSTFVSNLANMGGAIYAKDVYLDNSIFRQNHAKSSGGAVVAEHTANVTNCLFELNYIEDEYGGAVYIKDSYRMISNIENSIFNSNSAYMGGGAVSSFSILFVNNCTFYDNHAKDDGGAIHGQFLYINANQSNTEPFNTFFIKNTAGKFGAVSNNGGAIFSYTIDMTNTYFYQNQAAVDGGAAYAVSNMNVDHCLFEGNTASGAVLFSNEGGAIKAEEDITIHNSTFKDNSAEDYGGAVYAKNVYINTLQNTKEFSSFFIGNKAEDDNGGAVYADENVNAVNTIFNGNTAKVDGGAAYAKDSIDLKHCIFESNKATGANVRCFGGAIRAENNAEINNCTFRKNYAENKGGAIYASKVIIENTASYFESNIARDYGGAIYTDKFDKDVIYATFIDNKAENDDGGAIYINNENWITFSQCVFVSNHCGDEGGAIYLDSSKSHLTLFNNIFIANSANEGQSVFNCGHYDSIRNNFWAVIPAYNNDQLIEWTWKLFNFNHVDSNPLKLSLNLTPNSCNVNRLVLATVNFLNKDGSVFSEGVRTDAVSFLPNDNIKFGHRIDGRSYVKILLTPTKSGTYNITANVYGQLVSKTLDVSSQFKNQKLNNQSSTSDDNRGSDNRGSDNKGLFDNVNNAIVNNVLFDNGNGGIENVVLAGYISNYDSGDNFTDNQLNNNNHSSANSTIKSINQPNSSSSNSYIYLALILVLIVLCGTFVWKKMKN